MNDAKKAEDLYEHIFPLLKGQEGKIVALDIESGDFFIGKDTLEAYEQGIKKHPQKEFFFKRVGAKTAFVIGAVHA